MPSFAERAKAVIPPRNECDTCNFLARLPDDYRLEVVEAMSDRKIATATIFKLLEADGHEVGFTDGAFNRHRRGQCKDKVREALLGDADGVIR